MICLQLKLWLIASKLNEILIVRPIFAESLPLLWFESFSDCSCFICVPRMFSFVTAVHFALLNLCWFDHRISMPLSLFKWNKIILTKLCVIDSQRQSWTRKQSCWENFKAFYLIALRQSTKRFIIVGSLRCKSRKFSFLGDLNNFGNFVFFSKKNV